MEHDNLNSVEEVEDHARDFHTSDIEDRLLKCDGDTQLEAFEDCCRAIANEEEETVVKVFKILYDIAVEAIALDHCNDHDHDTRY
jgi:hypothetical protein